MTKRTAIISVSTYNCPKYLRDFCDSFTEYTKETDDIEILVDVHNDDPRHNSWDYMAPYPPGIWDCHNDGENVFWGERRNRMITHALDIAESDDDYIFLFDDDMRFTTPNWLPYVMRVMDTFTDVGILGLHWARLKDGKTRQAHHAPTRIITQGELSIHEKRFVPGNSWVCRPEALRQTGPVITAATREEWKAQSPGADTEYHNRMLEKTDFILAATVEDLVWHAGLDEMK